MMSVEVDELRVMSFNIRYDNPKDGSFAWPKRKEKVASMIRLHKADVIGIQEAMITQIKELQSLLEDEFGWIGRGRDDGKQGGEFVPIFFRKSKLEIMDQGDFWLSTNPSQPGSKSWKTACPRMCTWAQFRIIHHRHKQDENPSTFFFFNTHLDHESSQAQIEGVKLITEQIDSITKLNQTVLLTGDFNCEPNSEPVKYLTTAKDNPKRLVMTDTRHLAKYGHHGPTDTFTGFRFESGILIDYIMFYTPSQLNNIHGIEVIEVLNHASLCDVWDGNYPPSDHRPLITDLRFKRHKGISKNNVITDPLTMDVEFCWPYEGENVAIAGDFNNWRPQSMRWYNGGFRLTVALSHGRTYQYKFFVDNVWKHDGNKPVIVDRGGNVNNAIEAVFK